MISDLLHRWLRAPLWLQMLLMSLIFLLLMACLWRGWGAGVQQHGTRLNLQYQQQASYSRKLLRNLAARGSLTGIGAEIARFRQAVAADSGEIFSLHKLTSVSHGALTAWQPQGQGQGGSVALRLQWPQVQSVFSYLGSLSLEVALPHFNLTRENQQLRLELSLVVKNEQ